MRSDHFRLAAAPAPIGALGGSDFETNLPGLLGDHRRHGLCVVTLEPGERGIALNCGERCRFLGGRFLGLTIEALRA